MMPSSQFSNLFQQMIANPSNYQRLVDSLSQSVISEDIHVIEDVVYQILKTLQSDSKPQNKMFAIRLFKDLLPTASYGLMLYAQSYLATPFSKILEFGMNMISEDKDKYLFSDNPDANMAQMGKSAYRMAAQCIKFAAQSMVLHPYQRMEFPSMFRLQYNRLSEYVRFPDTYIYVKEDDKGRFSSNYNIKIKNIKEIIQAFQTQLKTKIDQCVRQGNFHVREQLVKFLYTGESNLIPVVVNLVCTYLKNPQISTPAKLQIMDFLNQIYVIGDSQIGEHFRRTVIPTFLQIVHPLDFETLTVVSSHLNREEAVSKKASQCLSFWGELTAQTSQMLQLYVRRSPLGRGSTLLKSKSAYSQALQLNLIYRKAINQNKSRLLSVRNLDSHVNLLTDFYKGTLPSNAIIKTVHKVINTPNVTSIRNLPNIPVIQSQPVLGQFRKSHASYGVGEQFTEEHSVINKLFIPSSSQVSTPSSALSNLRKREHIRSPSHQQSNFLDSRVSFLESNIALPTSNIINSPRLQTPHQQRITFMDQVQIQEYLTNPGPQPGTQTRDNWQGGSVVQIQPMSNGYSQVKQIEFVDSYVSRRSSRMAPPQNVDSGVSNEYGDINYSECVSPKTVIKTVFKPKFGFPPVKPQQQTSANNGHQASNKARDSEYFDVKEPLWFQQNQVRVETVGDLSRNERLLKRSQSSCNNGALFNLDQSLRGLESPPSRLCPTNPLQRSSSTLHQQRIRVLEEELQNCVTVEQTHQNQMQKFRAQLNQINSKIQHIRAQPAPTRQVHFVDQIIQSDGQILVQHPEPIQEGRILATGSGYQHSAVTKSPSVVQQWYHTHRNSRLMQIHPIRMPMKRKRQLIKSKEVLHRSNQIEIGFISVLKEYLEVTIYYYFNVPIVNFKTQIVSPNLKSLDPQTFFVRSVEAGTQKRQTILFSHPNLASLPFITPQLIVNYNLTSGSNQQLKIILPCITLKLMSFSECLPPLIEYKAYHSHPVRMSPLFLRRQNLFGVLPGLTRLNQVDPRNVPYGVVSYGVAGSYLTSCVFLRINILEDKVAIVQIYEMVSDSGIANLIFSVMEQLLSIIASES